MSKGSALVIVNDEDQSTNPKASHNNGPLAKQTKITELIFVLGYFAASLVTTVTISYYGLIFLALSLLPIVLIFGLESEVIYEKTPQTDLVLITILKFCILSFSILLYILTANPWTLFSLLLMLIPYAWHMLKAELID